MTPRLATAGPPQPAHDADKIERRQLLFALADLDNAYKSGKLDEAEYQQKRQEIKKQLRAIWEIK